MRLRFFKGFIAALTLLTIISCSTDTTTVNFTADMVQKINARRIEGKIFVKGDEYRMDIKENNEELSILVNSKSGKHTVLVHSQKVASEYLATGSKSLSNNPFENLNYLFKRGSSDTIGSEIINGYECTKIEVFNDRKKLLTAWVSDSLNWPLKIVTEVNPSKDVELSNIKEQEVVKASLFKVPDGYKVSLLPEKKKDKPQIEEKREPLPDIGKMKKAVLEKLREKGIDLETDEGTVEVREFGATVLKKYFSGWRYFRIVRSKETKDKTSSAGNPIMNAVVSNDITKVYFLSSLDADTTIDMGIELFKNREIKPDNEKTVKDFGKALTLLYFVGTRVEDVEPMNGNKWGINLINLSGKRSFFTITLNKAGNIKDIEYKIK
ncbi:MAG: DUF4412 domain-containing protein [candidate division WOR-3 bacterium]